MEKDLNETCVCDVVTKTAGWEEVRRRLAWDQHTDAAASCFFPQSLVSVTQLITSKAPPPTSGRPAVTTQQRGIATQPPGGRSRIRIELRGAKRQEEGGAGGVVCVTDTCGFVPSSLLEERKTFWFGYILEGPPPPPRRVEVGGQVNFQFLSLIGSFRRRSAEQPLCVPHHRQVGLLAATNSPALCCLLQVVGRSGRAGLLAWRLWVTFFLCAPAAPCAFGHQQTLISVLSATLRG